MNRKKSSVLYFISVIIPVIVCCAVLSSFPVFGASAVSTDRCAVGDVNQSSRITAADARIILRASAKLDSLDAEKTKLADINGNSKIETSDAKAALRIAVQLDPYPTHTFSQWSVSKKPTADEVGLNERKCTKCGYAETSIIPIPDPDAKDLAAYFRVENGKVVNKADTGAVISGASVDGEYFTGGKVTLPSQLRSWTLEMVVDYNELSQRGVIDRIAYWTNIGKYEECDNVFRLEEVTSRNKAGQVRVAWVSDSWNHGYKMTVPVQLYARTLGSSEYLPDGDIFFGFTSDGNNGVMTLRINGKTSVDRFSENNIKNYGITRQFPASFSFTTDHRIKEFRLYSVPVSDKNCENAYKSTGIVPPTENINQIVDGLTELGSSLAFVKSADGTVTMFPTEKAAGTYSTEGFYRSSVYTIKDFVQPDNGINNKIYESVHITNEPQTMITGKQYPLTAFPAPYSPQAGSDGKSPEFDVSWKSSDPSVIAVVDGLLIAKKAGTAKITATLTGTNISDTVTITVADPVKTADKVWNVPADYVSKNGYSFSQKDYGMTTHAIYDAIDEASANGFNHIVFPKIEFRAAPLMDERTKDGYRYYVPSGMTIEFPEGSVFRMMDTESSRASGTPKEHRYFSFGVPETDYQNVCENSHIIIDTYYGERYQMTDAENSYLEGNNFIFFGRKAINCSVRISNAYSPAGYFIAVDGRSRTNTKTGVMSRSDFVQGGLDDNGKITADKNRISTKDFITVPDYGKDGYFIAAAGQDSHIGKYFPGCQACMYDIQWFDSAKKLIKTERYLGVSEYYTIPEKAAFFKLSLMQSAVDFKDTSPWIAMHDDGSAKMCEIKNTKVFNSATGVFSVIGQTDGLWVHDCYTDRDGTKPGCERIGDFEDGWYAMRHCVVSNNFLTGYFGCPGGFNIFFHSNYISDYSGKSGETAMLRYINNTTQSVEISEKTQAHVYNNTINQIYVDRFAVSRGHIYDKDNLKMQSIYNY